MDLLGLYGSKPEVLYDSEALGSMKVVREVVGEYRCPWNGKILRAAWLGPEGSEMGKDWWEREAFLNVMKVEKR